MLKQWTWKQWEQPVLTASWSRSESRQIGHSRCDRPRMSSRESGVPKSSSMLAKMESASSTLRIESGSSTL